MKLLTKLYLAIGLILLVFSFVTVTYIRQNRKVADKIKLVLGSTEIIRVIENNQKSILDMETGLRGYLIGEQEMFLEPYYKGEKEVNNHLNGLAQLTPHAKGKKLIEEIRILVQTWEKNFALPLIQAKRRAIRNPQDNKPFAKLVEEIVKPGEGKKLLTRSGKGLLILRLMKKK